MNKNLSIQKYIIKLILILVCGMSYGQVEIKGKVISKLSKETLWFSYSIKPNIKEDPKSKPNKTGLEVVLKKIEINLQNHKEKDINEIIVKSEKKVRDLLTNLPKDIKVIAEVVDCDLNALGGVIGRTKTNNPAIVAILISNKFKGSISNALDIG